MDENNTTTTALTSPEEPTEATPEAPVEAPLNGATATGEVAA